MGAALFNSTESLGFGKAQKRVPLYLDSYSSAQRSFLFERGWMAGWRDALD